MWPYQFSKRAAAPDDLQRCTNKFSGAISRKRIGLDCKAENVSVKVSVKIGKQLT